MTLKGQGYRGLYRRTDRESKIEREKELGPVGCRKGEIWREKE